mgnify:CR=1 FL=1
MYSQTVIIGTLGAAPETKVVGNEKQLSKLSVATDYKYKVGEEWKKRTDWHRVVVWGWQAGTTKNWQKGQKVFVEGRMETRSWEDRNGNKKYTTELIANNIKNFDHVSSRDQGDDGVPNFDSNEEIPF